MSLTSVFADCLSWHAIGQCWWQVCLLGAGMFFGLDKVGEGLKNIGFEEKDVNIEIKIRKKKDSPPPNLVEDTSNPQP